MKQIMLKLKRKISEENGTSLPLLLGMFVLLLLLFLLFAEYLHFVAIYNKADDAIERSVISVATQNWDNVYQGVREGYAGGNQKKTITDAWTVVLDKDEIIKEAAEIMGVTLKNGKYVKESSDGKLLYSIKPQTVQANIINVDTETGGVTNVGSGKGLVVEITYDIEVAWFTPAAWNDAHPITVSRTVRAKYKPLY